MYSTPMDNIQAEFDEHNKPDDYLAKYVYLLKRKKKDFYPKLLFKNWWYSSSNSIR